MSKFSRLVTMAYESELRADHMTDEEMEAAAEDQSIHTEVATDVEMPAAEIAEGAAEIETAVDDANSLSDTAEMLEEAADEGQGVDPVAAELVNEKIQAAAEKYQLAASHRTFSRESFNTRDGRVEVTRYLAAEAEEKSKSIWERIKAWFKAAWEFIKKYWNRWMTAAGRLRAKAHAVNEKLRKDVTMKTDKEINIDASRLGSRSVVDESKKLASFKVNEWVDTMTVEHVSVAGIDSYDLPIKSGINVFNGTLGGVKIVIEKKEKSNSNEAISLPVLSIDESELKSIHGNLKTLTVDEARTTIRNVITGLQNLQRQESALNKAIDKIKNAANIESLNLGSKDDKSKSDTEKMNEKILAETATRCLSIAKQSAAKVSATAMRVASVCIEAISASIDKEGENKVYKTRAWKNAKTQPPAQSNTETKK